MQSRNSNNFKGIDISNYEKSINLTDAKAQGISIVILKATEGEHTKDPAFRDLYGKAKAAGLKVGAYHFLHVGGVYSVDAQVNNFCEAISGLSFDCKIAVDVEDGGYHGGTPAHVTSQILDFAAKFTEKTGLACIVYSNTAFIKEHFTSAIKALPLWVANYGVNTPYENGIYDTWLGFQYSDKGNIGGCTVDLDEFTCDIFRNASQTQITSSIKASPQIDYSKFPGAQHFGIGKSNPYITKMGERLIAHGFGRHYNSGAGPTFTQADLQNYREWQLALGYSGAAADGIPGEASWNRLISDAGFIPAYPGAEFFRSGVISAFCCIAENALINAGCNCFKSIGNPWGSGDIRSYKAFQKKIGDRSMDGIPGLWGWSKLQRYM